MKAMILAAGQGTRMRPITLTSPKPMIPLLEKPVMQALIEHLRDSGIRDIVINTSYLSEDIQNYFKNGQSLGVNIAYSFEGEIRDGELVGEAIGSGGGIRKIQDFSGFFDETFLVLCGDAFVDFNVQELYEFHQSNDSVATILMREVDREEVPKYGVVATDASGKIQQFQEKPAVEDAISNVINTGIYMFEPSVIDYIPQDTVYDIGSELFPALVENNEPFYGLTQDFQWIDIGALPDFAACHDLILTGAVDGFEIPGEEIARDIFVNSHVSIDLDNCQITGPVYIASGCRIEPGATIEGPAAIGPGCIIEENAVIRRSYLDAYKRVSAGTTVEDTVLYAEHCIDREGNSVAIEASALKGTVYDARINTSKPDSDMKNRRKAA